MNFPQGTISLLYQLFPVHVCFIDNSQVGLFSFFIVDCPTLSNIVQIVQIVLHIVAISLTRVRMAYFSASYIVPISPRRWPFVRTF